MRTLDEARAALAARGLDLLQPFSLAAYNSAIEGLPRLSPLPTFGRPSALGLLVANTRALWPPFLEAYRADSALRESADPLDRYVEEAVKEAAAKIEAETFLRFGHEGGARLVSMLRLAEAAGLASVGPAHLAVHPEHGPWFALRAVIGVDLAPPEVPEASAVGSRESLRSPCEGCAAPCVEAMRRALEKAEPGLGRSRERAEVELKREQVIASWRDWLAVREACPVGAQSRYSEAQARYHYARDRSALEESP